MAAASSVSTKISNKKCVTICQVHGFWEIIYKCYEGASIDALVSDSTMKRNYKILNRLQKYTTVVNTDPFAKNEERVQVSQFFLAW